MEVAAKTSVSEIGKPISTSVLFGDDMLDLKRGGDVGLGETAIFTLPSSAVSDFIFDCLIHPWNLMEISARQRLASL